MIEPYRLSREQMDRSKEIVDDLAEYIEKKFKDEHIDVCLNALNLLVSSVLASTFSQIDISPDELRAALKYFTLMIAFRASLLLKKQYNVNFSDEEISEIYSKTRECITECLKASEN